MRVIWGFIVRDLETIIVRDQETLALNFIPQR